MCWFQNKFGAALTLLIATTMQLNADPSLTVSELETASQSSFSSYYPSLANAPADITFGVADLKYDHGVFKILECGNAPACSQRDHPLLIGNTEHILETPYWEIVEHLLKKIGLDAWFVGNPHKDFLRALDKKRVVRSFDELVKQECFSTTKAPRAARPKALKDHLGCVFQRITKRNIDNSYLLTNFVNDYPAFLLVNAYSNNYLFSKVATYQLFQDAGLADYVPRQVIYPTGYNENLAHNIITDLAPADRFVIKPLNQTMAIGVSVATADTLDQHLQHLFGTEPIALGEAKSIGYWRTTRDSQFLVAAFASSQAITYENKVYEPSMRIVYFMTHEAGTVNVMLLGGFWKVPASGINDLETSLTSRYVTDRTSSASSPGIRIEYNDLATLKRVVSPVLGQAYKTILEQACST